MSTYPRRKGELVQSADVEGFTVYVSGTDSLHKLNESAHAIWELCDGDTTPEEMAAAISELTGLELKDARVDVASTLHALIELGLLESGS